MFRVKKPDFSVGFFTQSKSIVLFSSHKPNVS